MYRAYDMTTEWMGPARDSLDEALADKAAHEAGCREQGGFADAIIVRPDPESEGRCVTIGEATSVAASQQVPWHSGVEVSDG
jgi:hypothetical protein